MTVHFLKTWPAPFLAVWHGAKRYEVRKDDREFDIGDLLVLACWDPEQPRYHASPIGFDGRIITARVSYKTRGGEFGLPEGLCVLGIEVEQRYPKEPPEEPTGE